MIGIIDYDAGNIKSVEKALHLSGTGNGCITDDPDTIIKCRQGDTSRCWQLWRRNGKA